MGIYAGIKIWLASKPIPIIVNFSIFELKEVDIQPVTPPVVKEIIAESKWLPDSASNEKVQEEANTLKNIVDIAKMAAAFAYLSLIHIWRCRRAI